MDDINELKSKILAVRALVARCAKSQLTDDDRKLLMRFINENPHLHPANDYETAVMWLRKLRLERELKQRDLVETGQLFRLPDESSAAPNALLRGRLFAPIARGRRSALVRKEVAHHGDWKVEYTGLQLDQADLDVMLAITQLLSEYSHSNNTQTIRDDDDEILYTRIKVTRYGLLKKVNRKTDLRSYRWLEDSLDRLGGRLIVTKAEHGRFSGSVIGNHFVDTDGNLTIDINQAFVKLFQPDQFAMIDMEQRLKLPSGFAKWLHAFISTHSNSGGYSAEKLMELSGSKTKRLRDFMRQSATPAFDELKASGAIQSYVIDGHIYRWKD